MSTLCIKPLQGCNVCPSFGSNFNLRDEGQNPSVSQSHLVESIKCLTDMTCFNIDLQKIYKIYQYNIKKDVLAGLLAETMNCGVFIIQE